LTLLSDLQHFWDFETPSFADRHAGKVLIQIDEPVTIVSSGGKPDKYVAYPVTPAGWMEGAQEASIEPNGSPFTWITWVRLAGVGVRQAIISKNAGAAVDDEYEIDFSFADSTFRFFRGGTGYDIIVSNSGLPVVGQWYFLACWFDGTNLRIEVDDAAGPAAVPVTGTPTVAAVPLGLGVLGAGSFPLAGGDMDGTGFWKRVLTAAERTFLRNSGAGRTWAEIMAY
jgi:hypothetical protein